MIYWVIFTYINGEATEHSRYTDIEAAYAAYDNLDFDTFDDALVERVEE